MTQTAFCFTTLPFCLLTLPASLLVWSRVYFYCVVGTAASMAFFASPGKAWLIHQLKIRNNASSSTTTTAADEKKTALQNHQGQQQQQQHSVRPEFGARKSTHESMSGDGYGGLGLPDDPQREFQEAVAEIKEELEVRQRRGSKITVPSGEEMRRMVEERLGGSSRKQA